MKTNAKAEKDVVQALLGATSGAPSQANIPAGVGGPGRHLGLIGSCRRAFSIGRWRPYEPMLKPLLDALKGDTSR
jgi:hypothetical protein